MNGQRCGVVTLVKASDPAGGFLAGVFFFFLGVAGSGRWLSLSLPGEAWHAGGRGRERALPRIMSPHHHHPALLLQLSLATVEPL